MKQLVKAIKFELFKLIKNKSLVIGFLVFFILITSILILSGNTTKLSDENILTQQEKEFQTQFYLNEKQKCEEIIATIDRGEPLNFVHPSDIYERSKIELARYNYLLETGTFMNDYNTHNQSHIGSFRMMGFLEKAGWVLPLFSIILVFYVMNTDYKNGSIKNIMASPIDKKVIFIAKSNCVNIVILATILVFSIYPMIEGLRDLSARELLYNGKEYYSQSLFTVYFLPKTLSTFLSMILWSGLTILTIFIKNKKLANVLPFIVYALAQVLHIFFPFLNYRILPLINMRYSFNHEHDNIFGAFSEGWLTLILTVIAVAFINILTTYYCSKRLSKQDLRS